MGVTPFTPHHDSGDPTSQSSPDTSKYYPLELPAIQKENRVHQKLAWLEEKRNEGIAFLKSQPNYDKISNVIDAVMGTDESRTFNLHSPVSHTRTNRVSKLFTDRVSMLTDIRPFWEYTVTNRAFEQHASN
jgi:hypothetical protein